MDTSSKMKNHQVAHQNTEETDRMDDDISYTDSYFDDAKDKKDDDSSQKSPTMHLEDDTDESDSSNDNMLSSVNTNNGEDEVTTPKEEETKKERIWAKTGRHMAKYPRIYFWISFLISVAISVVGIYVGGFTMAVDNAGWNSRGTLISKRQTQLMLIRFNSNYLREGGDDAWSDLIDNIQPGWNTDDDDDTESGDDNERRLLEIDSSSSQQSSYDARHPEQPTSFSKLWNRRSPKTDADTTLDIVNVNDDKNKHRHNLPSIEMAPHMTRRLQEEYNTSGSPLEGCDVSWYSARVFNAQPYLWPVWQVQNTQQESPTNTALNGDVIRDLCHAEEATQNTLIEKGLCNTCGDDTSNRCSPPYGLVFYTRLALPNGFDLTCDELGTEWDSTLQQQTEEEWQTCVSNIYAESYIPGGPTGGLPQSCLNASTSFSTHLLDEFFDGETNHQVVYTSSIFATVNNVDALYEHADSYNRAGSSSVVEGTYDTQYEDFVNLQVDEELFNDMQLAMGSAFVTAMAILIHTRSQFITLIGILQIILSFPLAYFFYTLILQLEFFPFLNFIGIFVIFALGADDIFVAVDKWKNSRLEYGDLCKTEEIAAKALPDAASAMLLTTITTAAAFFATAVCPVAGIQMFAIFCGLLIVFDYLMCILLVFPALCMYDRARHKKNCCLRCHGCRKVTESANEGQDAAAAVGLPDDKPSLIRRILLGFYDLLHRIRWILLIVVTAALIVCAYYASTIELPASSDVRLLNADSYQYEKNYEWRLNILYQSLLAGAGSQAFVIWGVRPADTGDHKNPNSWSQLVLDDTFDPSSTESQLFMLGFCDRFFSEDFAERKDPDYVCPMNGFDTWLQHQSSLSVDEQDEAYITNCNGAESVPVPQDTFDSCFTAWAEDVAGDFSVLSRNGVVEVMYIKFASRVRWDSHYDDLNEEWHLIEDWVNDLSSNSTITPTGVKNFYFTSEDFWWYDTNGQMLNTAYTSALIAISIAFAIMLFTSRSFVLTIFCTITIGYVLTSVTATLAAFGWTLGFLESICFAILIGISCDFVIHFSHSYASPSGNVSRHDRTKFALIHMGPSILAAAFTTVAAAVIMLFTVITFFQKFAMILFLTVLQATIGSFIVFLTLADCLGPSQPTYLIDNIIAKCMNQEDDNKTEDEEDKIDSPELKCVAKTTDEASDSNNAKVCSTTDFSSREYELDEDDNVNDDDSIEMEC